MAALTANSWTVTFRSNSIDGGTPPRRRVVVDLALAGVDTYPDNGIPLPPLANLGFKQVIHSFNVTGVDPTAGGTADYSYKYDATNHKLFVYGDRAAAAAGLPLTEATTAEVPGPRTLRAEITGW